jgi:hypothetical protein
MRTVSINDVRRINFVPRTVDPVGGVDRNSAVFATITEVFAPPGEPLEFPFIGQAMLSVWNVAPHDDGSVELALRVVPDFFDLNVRLQFLVCND